MDRTREPNGSDAGHLVGNTATAGVRQGPAERRIEEVWP